MKKRHINLVMFSCGHRGKRTLATFQRGEDWTRAYTITGASAIRLADVIRKGVAYQEWIVLPHTMGWSAYPARGVKK